LPGNSYKHWDEARVGKGHVTASAMTQQLKTLEWFGYVNLMGKTKNVEGFFYGILFQNTFLKLREREKDNTKIYLKELGCRNDRWSWLMIGSYCRLCY
jgi:hypothetical protein